MTSNGWMVWSGGDTMQDGCIGRWKGLCGMSMMIKDEISEIEATRPQEKEDDLSRD